MHNSTSTALHNALKQYFGYTSFRDGQLDVINAMLNGQDSLVLMPTGGGKSLCYQLPATLLPGLTIVISPLIALMKDQVDGLIRQGIPAAFINSSLEQNEINQIFQQMANQQLKLVYIAPERLASRYFLDGIANINISLFAIDEAHCISQWGHDFRPAYTNMGCLKQYFPHIPIMALTATADVTTRKDILQQLQLVNPYVHLDSFDRPNIRLTLAEKYRGEQQVVSYVQKKPTDCGIIYCNSRWRVENIAQSLKSQGIKAAAYHAGLDVSTRNKVQDDFTKDNILVVVATVAFGLGINKPNIRYVLHFEPPRTLESYYQEIGRAGRDGLSAEAIFLHDEKDTQRIKKQIAEGENEQRAKVETQRFDAMSGFIEAQTCRRQVVLNYFAEYTKRSCGNCDICLDPPSQFDATIAAQKVLSCVYRIQQSGDIDHVIDVLRGIKTPKILQQHHDKVSTFGIGKEKTVSYWFAIVRQLIHLGYLQQDIASQSTICLTEASREILKGTERLMLATPRLQNASYWRKNTNNQKHDKALFSKLRELRKVIADAENIPPYIVFNDATLSELARVKPTNDIELLNISGIGNTKLARYGKPFIDVIKEHH